MKIIGFCLSNVLSWTDNTCHNLATINHTVQRFAHLGLFRYTLVTFLIWPFGSQDQNRQIYITKFAWTYSLCFVLAVQPPNLILPILNYSLILCKSPNLMIANVSGYMVLARSHVGRYSTHRHTHCTILQSAVSTTWMHACGLSW